MHKNINPGILQLKPIQSSQTSADTAILRSTYSCEIVRIVVTASGYALLLGDEKALLKEADLLQIGETQWQVTIEPIVNSESALQEEAVLPVTNSVPNVDIEDIWSMGITPKPATTISDPFQYQNPVGYAMPNRSNTHLPVTQNVSAVRPQDKSLNFLYSDNPRQSEPNFRPEANSSAEILGVSTVSSKQENKINPPSISVTSVEERGVGGGLIANLEQSPMDQLEEYLDLD
jgi:hypothetical protein